MKKLLSSLLFIFFIFFILTKYILKVDATLTILQNILTIFVIFFFNDFVYQQLNINGCWELEEKTIISEYNPYKNMKVKYKVLLWCEGNNIHGTGERFYEQTADGKEKYYKSNEKINIKINGYINRHFLLNNKFVIHYEENGVLRKSSTIHNLTKKKLHSNLQGSFFKTAANSKGISRLKKVKSYD